MNIILRIGRCLVWALGICFLNPLALESLGAEEPVAVRVAVLKDVPSFSLGVKRRFRVLSLPGEQLLWEKKRLPETRVFACRDGICFGETYLPVKRLKILPHKDGSLRVANRRFRGELDILIDQQKKMTVINVVALEDYVKGVLYHEISHHWPIAAIKAQAVATRTYALYRIQEAAGAEFDVTSDIYSQVYGGQKAERYRTTLATDETQGLVLKYSGKILPAYFHAACAGATEDASNLWKIDLAPLRGVVCKFCRLSPHASWKKNFRSQDIQEKLNVKGYAIGAIKDISIVERTPSGRIKDLKITDRQGKVLLIPGKDFRQVIGPNVVRSNNYEVRMQGYYFDLIGHGWGHGVGLCQWGAFFMSKEGHDFQSILTHYYPGAQIVPYAAERF